MRISNGRTDRQLRDKRWNALRRMRGWLARLLVRAADAISHERVHADVAAPEDVAVDPLEQWRARVREAAPELLLPPEQGGIPPVVYKAAGGGMPVVSSRARAARSTSTDTVAAASRIIRSVEERVESAVRSKADVIPAVREADPVKPQVRMSTPGNERKHTAVKESRSSVEQVMRSEGRTKSDVIRSETLNMAPRAEQAAQRALGGDEESRASRKYASVANAEPVELERSGKHFAATERWPDLPPSNRDVKPVHVIVGAQQAEAARASNEDERCWPPLGIRSDRALTESAGATSSMLPLKQCAPQPEPTPDVREVFKHMDEAVLQSRVSLDEGRWPELLPEETAEQEPWRWAVAERDHWRALDAEQRGAG